MVWHWATENYEGAGVTAQRNDISKVARELKGDPGKLRTLVVSDDHGFSPLVSLFRSHAYPYVVRGAICIDSLLLLGF
jgi:hypothetical protein